MGQCHSLKSLIQKQVIEGRRLTSDSFITGMSGMIVLKDEL